MTVADVLFGLAFLTVGGGVGLLVGYRRGVAASWLMAATAFMWATRGAHVQLARLEREAAERAEREHAVVAPDPAQPLDRARWLQNPAGYQSARINDDSPTRTGAGPSAPSQREARV